MVNMIDLGYNFIYQGLKYEHDDDFVASFSFKVHQVMLTVWLAIISGQFMHPTA